MDKTKKKRNIDIFLMCKHKVKYSEIAERYGISENTVKTIYFQMRNEQLQIKEKLNNAIDDVEIMINNKEKEEYQDYNFRIQSYRYNELVEKADFLAYIYDKAYC